MNTPATKHDRFEGFRWEIVPGALASEEVAGVLQNRFSTFRERLDRLDPDDRAWFVLERGDGSDLFVKVFRYTSFLKRLRYTALGSQAKTEWEHLLRLRDSAVRVPEPVGFGVSYDGRLLNECVLVTEHVAGADTLRSHVRALYGTDAWPGYRERLWIRLAGIVDGLAEEGFFHDDLHDQNLIVAPADPKQVRDTTPEIVVTDLHRATVKRRLSRRTLLRMLAFLGYSMTHVLPPWELRRFYRVLTENTDAGSRLPGWSTFTEHLVQRKRAYLKSRTESAFKENVSHCTLEKGRWSVYHDPEVPPEEVRAWIGPRDGNAYDEDRVLKRRSDGRVVRRSGGNREVVVKETFGRPLKRRGERLLGRSKARKSWRNAYGLKVRGISTPQALAVIEPTRSLSRDSSFFVQEYLEEAADAITFVRRMEAGGDGQVLRRKRRFTGALGRYLRKLHRKGIFHKDLKASNILVRRNLDEGYRFDLLDLDRMEFYDRPLPEGPRIKNLLQVNSALPAPLSRMDRWHGWRVYCSGPEVSFADHRSVLAEIMEKSRERDHEWP